MIARRTFLAGLGVAAAWPVVARGQQNQRVRRIGVLLSGVETNTELKAQVATFVQGLRNLGWIDGQTAHLEIRWNAGDAERTRTAAGELLGLSPDVILSVNTANLTALLRQAPAMPIVFLGVSDPVAQGFVSSLARPAGNITGFLSFEFSIGSKWIDLLKQIVPGLQRVTVVFNPDTAQQNNFLLAALESDAPSLGVEVSAARVHDVAGLSRAIEEASQRPKGGIIFPTDGFLVAHRAMVLELTARYRVPAVSFQRSFAEQGGLMSYGAESGIIYRQAAVYVDRILKGAKPSDLPIQSPTKFELVINLKTARALGIEVPMNLLLIADDYIQ
jgi:putative tryptophan/tyrosine transport system substrate-binding protein